MSRDEGVQTMMPELLHHFCRTAALQPVEWSGQLSAILAKFYLAD